ncbi:unnamed protein product, partial [Owenia fusiformis]
MPVRTVIFACVISIIETHTVNIAIDLSNQDPRNFSFIKFPRNERLDSPFKSFKVLTNARCAATCSATPETCNSYNLRKLVGDKPFQAICELNGPSATPPTPTKDVVDYYDRDECFSNPCLNGGTCDDGFHGYTCSCVPGYEGLRCDIDIDECTSNPCPNGGTCNDVVNGYTCSCVPGYEGLRCDVDIDECSSNPCIN